MGNHEHLSRYERDRMWNSQSRMLSKPQDNDYTFLASEMDKVSAIIPLRSRVFVELLREADEDASVIIKPFHSIKAVRSRVLAVGKDVNKKIRPGVDILHQHRCGLQIGFYGERKIYRIIPDRLVMGIYGCP